MFLKKRVLAIIPARVGSKRIPGKNIFPVAGKPLIAWTIEAAKKSKYIDRIIVSTDDQKIKRISEEFGAEVPFIRPNHLATDEAGSVDVIKHAISAIGEKFTYIVLLQPTSPLRTTEDIDNAIEKLDGKTKAVVSVCETSHSPLWCNNLPEDLSMADFLKPEITGKRSQDLPKYYRLNGALYVSETDYFYQNNNFFGKKTKAFIMPPVRSVDVDEEIDLAFAEFLLSRNLI